MGEDYCPRHCCYYNSYHGCPYCRVEEQEEEEEEKNESV